MITFNSDISTNWAQLSGSNRDASFVGHLSLDVIVKFNKLPKSSRGSFKNSFLNQLLKESGCTVCFKYFQKG
ncbi:hypothetical protein ACHWQZ_G016723 [Mnemiopsis leidyi]